MTSSVKDIDFFNQTTHTSLATKQTALRDMKGCRGLLFVHPVVHGGASSSTKKSRQRMEGTYACCCHGHSTAVVGSYI